MMDNFMDKLAQKLNAQEVIKANSQAEAAELKRLQVQVEEYEECLAEIKEVNRKNQQLLGQVQAAEEKSRKHFEQAEERIKQADALYERLQQLVEDGIGRIAAIPEADEEARRKELAETLGAIEEIRTSMEENQSRLSAMFAESDEFVHKENVKVYRNVQAVIVDEIKNQTSLLVAERQEDREKSAGLKGLVMATLLLTLINAAMLVVQLLTTFGIF